MLSVAFCGGLLFAANGVAHSRSRWLLTVELAGSLAAGLLYLRPEHGRSNPLVPLDLFRIPQFSLSVATSVAAFAANMQALLVLPFHLERTMGDSGRTAGLLLARWHARPRRAAIPPA